MLTRAVDIPLSERISNFLVNSRKLILNQDILLVVKGHNPIHQDAFSAKFQIFQK